MDKRIIGAAPMAGLSDRVMRALCYRMGANYACTEMVSAVGWMYAKDDNSVLPPDAVTRAGGSTNTAIQLFGKDPVRCFKEAAARATEMRRFHKHRYQHGLPRPQGDFDSGEGSALMKHPDMAIRLMEAVKAGTTLPVTVKMRLGYDEESLNALDAYESRRRDRAPVGVHPRADAGADVCGAGGPVRRSRTDQTPSRHPRALQRRYLHGGGRDKRA